MQSHPRRKKEIAPSEIGPGAKRGLFAALLSRLGGRRVVQLVGEHITVALGEVP